MASLIQGFEYDVFISYRQKDNKHDGWVTEFVGQLKGELESTFKEEIGVYFDINPHNGLLETHDVDASLKDKLKCLVFIPIISRTYCDPKSYAWDHEFKTYIEQTARDQFGLKVKLTNGNISSRILPVQIHELNSDDRALFERETGGVLRAIEFIYKEPGVNRPLTPDDDEKKNLNNTIYRNQINKVANAIDEIINSLKKIQVLSGEKTTASELSVTQTKEEDKRRLLISKAVRIKKFKKRLIVVLSVLLILAGSFEIYNIFIRGKQAHEMVKPDKSVAILPFSDFSVSHDQGYFANGIMEEIFNQLAKLEDLEVISPRSSRNYNDSKLPLKGIANALGVSNIVEGSVQKEKDSVRINVRLIDGNTEKLLWSDTFDRELSDIFAIEKDISITIAKQLKAILTLREKDEIVQIPTKSLLAYDYYLKGRQYNAELKNNLAIGMYSKAIEQDPEFVWAYLARASVYSRIFFSRGLEYRYSGDWKGFDKLAQADLKTALKINPDLPEVKLSQAEQLYRFERKHEKALELLDEVKAQMSNNPSFFSLRGAILRREGKWEESLNEWQKEIQLDPVNAEGYIEMAHTLRLIRKYPEAIIYYDKSLLFDKNPENQIGKFFTILCWKGDFEEALKMSELTISDLGGDYFYYTRQYKKLIPMVSTVEDQFEYFPKTLNLALAHLLDSNIYLSKQYADSAITELTSKIKDSPGDERYYAALGYAYGCKGENKKAVENVLKAIKLKPLELDAWQGYYKEIDLVKIYILTGEYDLAMDKIETLLSIPGDLSLPLLKIDPVYDRLRNLPRFQSILNTEYKTKF